MNKVENGYFIHSFKQWGNKPKCGCVEFSFENTTWFTSRLNLVASTVITTLFIGIGWEILEESKLKFPAIFLVTVFCLFMLVKLFFCVTKETLYVIAPIGVQFITSYLIGKESVWFVPWHSLQNFVIVEVIVGQQIFFYLGLQNKTNDSESLVILFQNTRPRLSVLEEMYRDIVELFLS